VASVSASAAGTPSTSRPPGLKEYWKQDLAADYGEWDDLEPYFALAGFTSAEGARCGRCAEAVRRHVRVCVEEGAVTMKGDQGVVPPVRGIERTDRLLPGPGALHLRHRLLSLAQRKKINSAQQRRRMTLAQAT
jgi:hypothetical protein